MGSEEQQRDAVIHIWQTEGKEYLWVRGDCEHCVFDSDESLCSPCFNHPNRANNIDKLITVDCPKGFCWIENTPKAIAKHVAGIMSDE